MMEMTTATATATAIAGSAVSPTDITTGQEVDIESRTWAGINKPGGHAIITKIHYDASNNGCANMVDVKYVLGGRELNVELTYVKVHVELSRRSRSRKCDTKMNVDTLGGVPKKKVTRTGKNNNTKNNGGNNNKKRKALASLFDDNGKVAKAAKKGEEEEEVPSNDNNNTIEATDEDGVWKLIEGGRITDYIDTLKKGQRVSYWWSDEDGWLPGHVSKSLNKVVTASTIRWTVKVNFDNTDVHTLNFHPLEKRWKVFHSNKKPEAAKKDEDKPKKKPAATTKKPTTKKSNKTAEDKKKVTVKKAGEKDKKVKAAKKKSAAAKGSSSTTTAKGGKQMKQSTLTFGAQLQSKIKEVSTKMHAAKKAPAATLLEGSVGGGLVKYSPNTIIAVKAAHAKSPIAPLPTASIGYCASLPPGTLSPDKKDGKKLPQELKCAYEKKRPSQVSLIAPLSAELQSKGSIEYAKSVKASGNGEGKTVMQMLHKKESHKAEEFVDYMTKSDQTNDKETASSPAESKDGGDLELKLDNERVTLFNSILSEIMFKQRLEKLDVEEMIEKMNTKQQASSKPFTLLEIKPYLQTLDDESRIFMVEDEGRMGTIYAV